jgi:hypothetical protein
MNLSHRTRMVKLVLAVVTALLTIGLVASPATAGKLKTFDAQLDLSVSGTLVNASATIDVSANKVTSSSCRVDGVDYVCGVAFTSRKSSTWRFDVVLAPGEHTVEVTFLVGTRQSWSATQVVTIDGA